MGGILAGPVGRTLSQHTSSALVGVEPSQHHLGLHWPRHQAGLQGQSGVTTQQVQEGFLAAAPPRPRGASVLWGSERAGQPGDVTRAAPGFQLDGQRSNRSLGRSHQDAEVLGRTCRSFAPFSKSPDSDFTQAQDPEYHVQAAMLTPEPVPAVPPPNRPLLNKSQVHLSTPGRGQPKAG